MTDEELKAAQQQQAEALKRINDAIARAAIRKAQRGIDGKASS